MRIRRGDIQIPCFEEPIRRLCFHPRCRCRKSQLLLIEAEARKTASRGMRVSESSAPSARLAAEMLARSPAWYLVI
jgi:hypothetical protein